MTFLKTIEPLLLAAEEYARAHDAVKSDLVQYNVALTKLLEAALEYAKWGKR